MTRRSELLRYFSITLLLIALILLVLSRITVAIEEIVNVYIVPPEVSFSSFTTLQMINTILVVISICILFLILSRIKSIILHSGS